MEKWDIITRSDKYKALPPEAQVEAKQRFFQRTVVPLLEENPLLNNDTAKNAAFAKFMQSPDDTGEGIVRSTLGSAIRGAGEIVPGTLQGVGALTGITPISDLGESARAGLEYVAPVNPIYEQGIPAKVANVAGNVASIIGTSGVGGLAGKALGAERAAAAGSAAARQALTNQAIQAGAKSALYGTGFAQGAAAKAEENERLGITGAEGYLNLLGGGVSELAPEMLPFGTALESAAARRLLGGVDDAAGRVIPGIRMSAAQEAAEGGSTQVLSNLSTQLTAPTGVEAPDLFEGAGEAALWEGVGGAMFGAINKLGRTPPEKQTDEQKAYAAELGAVPVDSTPPITPEESLENFNQGGIPVVSPDGVVTTLPFNREDIRATDLPFNREDIRASELPFTREDIRPAQLPFNREDIRSTELPFSRQNIRGLSQLGQPAISPSITAAVNTADSIVTTAENTSSDVSQATTAARNIIQGVVDTPQPQKAPAELPAVTPSPAMEQLENFSQTITDSNGEIAPEMSVLPPTVQAGAGVGEAIQAPKKSSRKPSLAPQAQSMLAQAAAINAGTQQAAPSTNEFVQKMTGQQPITPQGTPTPATEGTVMPGGSATPPSRGRPVERVVFEKPIKTPIGEIVSYDWQYKVEEVPDKEGEMGLRRFSDWDQAEKNADTGRDIVHQFTVRKPDGTTQLVSLESALGKIPVTAAKGFKAAIKAARRLPVYEAELARLELQQKNRIEAENKARKEGWKNSPPIELRDSGFPAAMAAGARMAWIGDNEVALVDKRDISEDGTRINSAIKSQEIKTEWAMGQIKTPSLSYGEQTRIDNLRRSIKRDKATLKENEITQIQSSSESAQGPQVVRGVSPSNLGENDTAQESPQTTTVAAPTEATKDKANTVKSTELRVGDEVSFKGNTYRVKNILSDGRVRAEFTNPEGIAKLPAGSVNITTLPRNVNFTRIDKQSPQTATVAAPTEGAVVDVTPVKAVESNAGKIDNSKVHPSLISADGTRKQLYHGKAGEFADSELKINPNNMTTLSGIGPAWFTTNKAQAYRFSVPKGNIMAPDMIALKKPLVIEGDEDSISRGKMLRGLLDFDKSNQIKNKSRFQWTEKEQQEWNEFYPRMKAFLDSEGVTKFKNGDSLAKFDRIEKMGASPNHIPITEEFRRRLDAAYKDLNHPDADPLNKVQRLEKEARVTLRATGNPRADKMPPGEAIRLALQIEGYDGIVLLNTMADTAKDEVGEGYQPSDWVIPFTPQQVVSKAQQSPQTTASEAQTPTPSRKGAGASGGVQPEPVEGSIPTVEQESATTAIESTEKTDVAKEAMRFLEADLTDAQRAKWTPEMFTAAQAFFDSGGKDFDSLKKAIKFPRVVQQAYLKADKEAAAEQTRREAADAAMAREVEKAEKEQAKLEADQKQREELGLKTLNSLIEKTRTNVVQGTVKSSDANQAVAILNKSGAIPNVLFTWIGTSKDFLADPANRARYPETWKAVSSNPNIEGMSENGQPIVFTDNVGVSDLDRNLAKLQGTTPEIAAVRRVILHENIHKGMFFLSLKDKMKLFQFLHRLYSPEELDQLAKSYDEYSDWRTNQVSYFSIIEEAMTRDFDSMAEIPRDGIWAEFMQFLRDIWQKITGKTSEPTLKNYKDVFRLIRNSLKNSEAANADRLKNGGATMMSMSEFISNVTPEQDAAYAKAVADGDMETAQRMVDAAAKAAGYNIGPIYRTNKTRRTVFDPQAGKTGPVVRFTGDKSYALLYGEILTEAYLRINNPFILDENATFTERGKNYDLSQADVDAYKAKGYDGILIFPKKGFSKLDFNGLEEAIVFTSSQIKSAEPVTRDEAGNVIPLSRRFQSASNDIRFSYAGESSIENLPEERRQFMRDSLDTAKAMAAAGKTSEEIRAVTGWFPGKYDGKMRWEVPDNEAVALNEKPELANLRKEVAEATSRFEEVKAKRQGFSPAFNEAQVRMTNAQDKLRRAAGSGDMATLGERLVHPELFALYPAAKNIRLVVEPMQPNYGGYFDPISNKIAINSVHSKEAQLSSLLHEIQHWTQKQENFAEGGDLSQFLYSDDFKLSSEDQNTVDNIDAQIADLRKEERELGEFFRNLPDSMKGVGKAEKESRRLNAISYEVRALNERRYAITKPARDKMAMDKYRRAAGEIEARDVQARQNFTPEQRKAIAPYSSDNIAKEDAIVMFGGSGPQASVTYDSPNEAAFNSGAEVARNADYDERDKAVRSTIRAAYDLAPKDNGPSVPLDQLFDIAKQSMPDLTENEFSQILQDLYEDSGALLQAGNANVTTASPTAAELQSQVRAAIDADDESLAKSLVPKDVTVIRLLDTQDLDEDGNPTEYFILSNGNPNDVIPRMAGDDDSYRIIESSEEYTDRDVRSWLFDGLFEGIVPKKDFNNITIHRTTIESKGGEFVLPKITPRQFTVTTPDGQRAGSVIVMPLSGLQTRAMASIVDSPATNEFTQSVDDINNGTAKAAFSGRQFKDFKPIDRTVKSAEEYSDVAIKYVNNLEKEGVSLEDIANSVISPVFLESIGIEQDLMAQDALTIEVRQRVDNAARKEKSPSRKKQLSKLSERLSAFWQGVGSKKGQHLGQRRYLVNKARYSWMFIRELAEKAMKEARTNILISNFGSENATSFTQNSYENADMANQMAADENVNAAENDAEWSLIKEGVEILEGEAKSIWQRMAQLLRRFAFYARRKTMRAANAKASITDSERNELNAILQMSDEEAAKAEAKDLAEFIALGKRFLGEESDADTPEKKTVRKKREKMVEVAKKRADKGQPIDPAETANDIAIRLLNEFENKLAKSAFFNSATKPDTIVKAFREQISDPMDRKAFKDRLMAMEVTSEMADRLFDKAARTKDNAQWKRAQDMLEGPNALRNILREINRARPSDQAPLSKQIPWRELLSQKAKTVEEYRQRIFDAISANEELKSATPDQKARLADLFAEAWEANRTRILDGMLERMIRAEEAKKNLSKEGAKALQEQRMRIVEDINLGIFDNDELAKRMAEKFGIKSEFTEMEREKINSLIEVLQDEGLNAVKRQVAAYKLLEVLQGELKIPVAKMLADFWVSSVLSGPNTIVSIGLAVASGAFELSTALSRVFISGFTNPKQLPSELAGAYKTLARLLSAFGRQANIAWQYLVTGDPAFLDPSMNDVTENMQWGNIGKSNKLAEQMAKSDKILVKSAGLFMRTVSRLLTALDVFNSGLTKEGSLSIVFRQLNLDPAKIEMLEKKSDLKAYKAQVIQDYFNNVQPKTLNEKALVDSYALADMMAELDKLGNVSENANFFGQQGAMTLDPSGLGGVGYRAIRSLVTNFESGSDRFLKKAQRGWSDSAQNGDQILSGLELAFAYALQFLAYNAANFGGVRFARFAGNKFNQGLSFIPGIGFARAFEAEFDPDRIRAKEAFIDSIQRNQLVGVMLSIGGYYILKAIADEPDDEKRGWFINGGWGNLTPEKKQQKLAAGEKEYTIGINGKVFNYANWPISSALAAIGSLSDLIRFSPDQWNDKNVAQIMASAAMSGAAAAADIPALSQFQELFGNSLSSKDPNEKRMERFAKVMSNYAGGFVPRFLKDIDYAQDPNLRKYETLWEKTASHIPVYRRYEGKEYYDILGQQIQRNVYPGSREFMVKPTDPAYKVLGALNSRGIWLTPANAEHRMVGKGARRRSLTQEEADNYSLETGKGYKQMLLRYGQRALQMPTERARAFLLDKADDVRDRALKKVYRGYTPAS